MTYTKWMTLRMTWVRGLSQEELAWVVEQVESHPTVETNAVILQATEGLTEKSITETLARIKAEALLWLSTRGEEGNDWGVPSVYATALPIGERG